MSPNVKFQARQRAGYPNIAFIKYWGNRNETLRLPVNGSISMNLAGLETCTEVTFHEGHKEDSLSINGKSVTGTPLERVVKLLSFVRQLAGIDLSAEVSSTNNFPSDAGIASSAAAFAALALAASRAAGLDLAQAELSRLARRGSGSACRSIPGGFVEWLVGTDETDSFAVSIAPPAHWDLVDCIAILSDMPKPTSTTQGQALAASSPLQAARILDTPRRLQLCRNAILDKDFGALAEIVELDSDMMHAVMMTSKPPLVYWQTETLEIMNAVRKVRASGLPACYTVDAGPNVHVLTESSHAERIAGLLRGLDGVKSVRIASAGGPAKLLN